MAFMSAEYNCDLIAVVVANLKLLGTVKPTSKI